MSLIPVRLGLQQRVLPVYRKALFEMIGANCPRGFSLLAGEPRPGEMIETCQSLEQAQLFHAHNRHLFHGKFYLCYQEGVNDWLNAWQPEVVIVEANPRYLSTGQVVSWMHRRSRPVIGWGLGAANGDGVLEGLRQALRKKFLQQFEALITYSAQGAWEYARTGFPEDRIFVAPNAVTKRPGQPLPQRLDSTGDELPLVLFVGRLQARKRVNLLLQACARLEKPPRLWIVGEGPERPELERLAQQIYPTARFWGAVYGERLDSIFSEADLFVLPGTGGLAIQQAMSFGLPVMVAEADGTQSDLVRASNGWHLPPGDLDALVEEMGNALNDIARLRQMGLESYRIVAEEINLEKMVSVFEHAVQRVCEG